MTEGTPNCTFEEIEIPASQIEVQNQNLFSPIKFTDHKTENENKCEIDSVTKEEEGGIEDEEIPKSIFEINTSNKQDHYKKQDDKNDKNDNNDYNNNDNDNNYNINRLQRKSEEEIFNTPKRERHGRSELSHRQLKEQDNDNGQENEPFLSLEYEDLQKATERDNELNLNLTIEKDKDVIVDKTANRSISDLRQAFNSTPSQKDFNETMKKSLSIEFEQRLASIHVSPRQSPAQAQAQAQVTKTKSSSSSNYYTTTPNPPLTLNNKFENNNNNNNKSRSMSPIRSMAQLTPINKKIDQTATATETKIETETQDSEIMIETPKLISPSKIVAASMALAIDIEKKKNHELELEIESKVNTHIYIMYLFILFHYRYRHCFISVLL